MYCTAQAPATKQIDTEKRWVASSEVPLEVLGEVPWAPACVPSQIRPVLSQVGKEEHPTVDHQQTAKIAKLVPPMVGFLVEHWTEVVEHPRVGSRMTELDPWEEEAWYFLENTAVAAQAAALAAEMEG